MMNIFSLLGEITLEGIDQVRQDLQGVDEQAARTAESMVSSFGDTEVAAGQMQDMYTAMAEGMQRESEETARKMQEEFDKSTAQVESDFDQLEENIKKSLENIDSELTKSYRNMSLAGGAVTAAISAVGIAAGNAADDIADWGVKLGISTDAVQELSYIASQNDLSMGQMGMAIRQQNTLLMDAAAGGDSATASLAKLGLTYQDLAGMNAEEQFFTIANAISGLGSAQEQSAAATDIWGARLGQNLLPMIAQGTDGIQALRDRYADLNAEMSPEQIENLQTMHDTWIDFKTTMTGFANTMGSAVAPVLNFVFNDLIIPAFKLAKTVIDAIPAPLKSAATAFIGTAAAAMTFFGGLGMVIQKIPTLVNTMKIGLGAVQTFGGGLMDGIRALGSFAKELLTTSAKFVMYIARLIPLIVAQSWAMATNFPVGTAAFIALMAGGAAVIYGIVRAIQALGGGGEGEGAAPEGAEAGMEGASMAATTAQETGGESVPELATGGLVKGSAEGTIVRVGEDFTDEVVAPLGANTGGIHVHIEGNEIIIPDESYMSKWADIISEKIASQAMLKARFV